MFYENLQHICELRGVKITPIVKECGGATGSISAWKNGAFPNADIVIKLAMRLNVSTDYLLMGTDAQQEEPLNDGEIEQLVSEYKELDRIGRLSVRSTIIQELQRIEMGPGVMMIGDIEKKKASNAISDSENPHRIIKGQAQ